MFLSILTFLTALCISVVAIYYSVAGLVAIFASAAIPVMIMGTALEVAKLVTAVWLHKYWTQTVWWLKTYLSVAIVLLMLITSMGIFGFLSKAHIDQAATATENIAIIEQLNSQINQDQSTISKAEANIQKLENQNVSQDRQIQDQINTEQQRIDSAYARIQPQIDEQNKIIQEFENQKQSQILVVNDQIEKIDKDLESLKLAIESNNVRLAQSIVNVKQDGSLGPGTQRAIQEFRDQQSNEKRELQGRIDQLLKSTDPTVDSARAEIQRLRSIAENEIADSNQLISRLRSQVGTVDRSAVEQQIAEQRAIMQSTQQKIESNTQRKFELESEYRKLEAEVGPIKYIAEFVYGNAADKNLLEEAVRWVIVLIIFVFDPLAVLLLIASQYSFKLNRELTKELKNEHSGNFKIFSESISQAAADKQQPSDRYTDIFGTEEKHRDHETAPISTGTETVGDIVNNDQKNRLEDLIKKESEEKWKLAKIRWKIDNPRTNTKALRQMYIDGTIDKLPWEDYLDSPAYRQNGEQDDSSLFTKIQQTK